MWRNIIKILHVIPSLNTGGAESMLVELSRLDKLKKNSIDLFVLQKQKVQVPFEKKVEFLGIKTTYGTYSNPYSPFNLWVLYKFLVKTNYDLVQAHLTPSQLWLAILKKMGMKNFHLITEEHSAYNYRRKTFLKLLDKFIYSQYERIVCGSEAISIPLIKWLPKLASKVQILPNGIDLQRHQVCLPLRRLNDLPSNILIVIVVARFKEPKDQVTCIRAMSELSNAHLYLVGDGPSRIKCEQLTKQLKLENKITFVGNHSDVSELLAGADVFVHSSGWEGLSIAILEAMASGLPIVASDVPGVREIVNNVGLLFSFKDVSALAGILKRLAADKELRKTLSDRSLKEVKKYSIELKLNGYYALYEDLLSSNQELKIV